MEEGRNARLICGHLRHLRLISPASVSGEGERGVIEVLLESRILAVGRVMEQVAQRLLSLGYQFENPAAAFPGVESGTDAAIERIEREIGPLPLSLKIFWRQVGSVNFIGRHEEWEGV